MIGLDTNVLVRILTGDDAVQQKAAAAHIRAHCHAADPGWINRIVTLEIVWVLERSYGYSREQVAGALERLLVTAELQFENHDDIRSAIAEYRKGADFADALLAQRNRSDTCSTTVTFDRAAAKRLSGYTLLAS